MKLPVLRPWRSSLTPRNAWPFTSNIPQEVLGMRKDSHQSMRTFPGDHDFAVTHLNDYRSFPAIDVRETTEGYALDADLPGMTENEIELELHNNILSIKGNKTRSEQDEDKEAHYLHNERLHGAFYREIAFEKEVNQNNVDAMFNRGVLHVELMKTNDLPFSSDENDILE